MPKDRPSLAFFALIATSLCAAVVLIALLIAGDVAGPKVATNNLPSHLRPVTDNDSRCYPEADSEARGAETYCRHYSGKRFYLRPDPCVESCAADF